MKIINFVSLLILFVLINSQVPDGKVINSCGKKGYDQPNDPSECKEKDTTCCFIWLEGTPKGDMKFCFVSPSKISVDDVKAEIKEYTGFDIKQLDCNDD